MRVVQVEHLTPEMRLGLSIRLANGLRLAAMGQPGDPELVQRLRDHGVRVVYVQGGETGDPADLEPRVALETWSEAVTGLARVAGELHRAEVFRPGALDAGHRGARSLLLAQRRARGVLAALTRLRALNSHVLDHSLRVMIISLMVGQALGWGRQQLRSLGLGGLLHDVGHSLVPAELHDNPGAWSDDEFKAMQAHTKLGADLLAELGLGRPVVRAGLQHHERWNGTGYLEGLAGPGIHPCARVVTVADAFDALIHDRPYRPAFAPREALELTMAERGRGYDPAVVDALLRCVRLYPVGSVVLLNVGALAVVSGENDGEPTRPVVRLLGSASGAEETVDLRHKAGWYVLNVVRRVPVSR